MTWGAVAMGGASIVGGLLGKKGADKSAANSAQMAKEDREFYQKQWAEALRANRPTQITDTGTTSWSQDDKGNWTQKNEWAAPEKARLDDFRQLAANRMGLANQMDLTKPFNYSGAGFGSNAAKNWSGNTGSSGYDPFKGYDKGTGYDPAQQVSALQYNINPGMGSAGGAALGGGRMGDAQHHGGPGPGGGMGQGMGQGMRMGQQGGPILGTPGNPAPIAPPPAQAPAPTAPPQRGAPAQGGGQDMEAVWKYIQEQQALKDNLWNLNSANSSPGQ